MCSQRDSPGGSVERIKAAYSGWAASSCPAATTGLGSLTRTSANITPHPEAGIGKWTDRQIKVAITIGQRANGDKMLPPMGYSYYKNIARADLDAIVAYLRSIKPMSKMRKVRHIPPKKK